MLNCACFVHVAGKRAHRKRRSVKNLKGTLKLESLLPLGIANCLNVAHESILQVDLFTKQLAYTIYTK